MWKIYRINWIWMTLLQIGLTFFWSFPVVFIVCLFREYDQTPFLWYTRWGYSSRVLRSRKIFDCISLACYSQIITDFPAALRNTAKRCTYLHPISPLGNILQDEAVSQPRNWCWRSSWALLRSWRFCLSSSVCVSVCEYLVLCSSVSRTGALRPANSGLFLLPTVSTWQCSVDGVIQCLPSQSGHSHSAWFPWEPSGLLDVLLDFPLIAKHSCMPWL